MTFFSGLYAKLALWGGVALGVLAAFFGAYRKGRSAERLEQKEKTVERIQRDVLAAREIERAVDGASDDDVVAGMRKQGWLRD